MRRWLIVACVSVAFCGLAWHLAARQFLVAYLAAILLPWSVSVGSLALMLTFTLTGGKWGRAAWPWLVLNARLMPLVALLFVPYLLGVTQIYPWANSDLLQQVENTENRQWFFQVPFYIGRTVFYFVIWSALAWLSAGPRLSSHWTRSDDRPSSRIMGGQPIAGLGLIAILLTVTWAGIDWVMSFDPFFGSTLFGALVGMGGVLSAISAVVAAVCFWPVLQPAATDRKTIADLSNLLLAFLMLWAYFSFAHFLIMWTGDLPTEASFYTVRTQGLWGGVAPVLALGGFVLPFLCLLSYDFKRSPRKIGTLAAGLLIVRLVELWWFVLPGGGDGTYAGIHWATIPATAAVISVYVAALVWLIDRDSQTAAGAIPSVW